MAVLNYLPGNSPAGHPVACKLFFFKKAGMIIPGNLISGLKLELKNNAGQVAGAALKGSKVYSYPPSVNILWTGGWDSTFALLRLVLEYKLPVIPFYIMDDARKSTEIEIETMERIREMVSCKYPFAGYLIAPTRYSSAREIAPDKEIEDAFKRLCKDKHVGGQYEWLSRFCKHNNLSEISICLEKITSHHPGFLDINPFLAPVDRGILKTYRIDPKYSKTDEHIIFRYFSFPVADVTKSRMHDIAREKGWDGIMRSTWSCLTPAGNSSEKDSAVHCGMCIPCLLLQAEGMGWRISRGRRAISILYWFCARPAKKIIKLILVKFGMLEKAKRLLRKNSGPVTRKI